MNLCTCCPIPRPVERYLGEPNGEWAHIDTQDAAEVRHVHQDHGSRDCDGNHGGEALYRVHSLNWDYIGRRWSDPDQTGPRFEDLWREIARMAIPPHAEHAEIRVTGGDRIEVHEVTDEGYAGATYRVCSDPQCAFTDEEWRQFDRDEVYG